MDPDLIEAVSQAIYEANGGLTSAPWAEIPEPVREWVRVQGRFAIKAYEKWTFEQMRAMQEAARAA